VLKRLLLPFALIAGIGCAHAPVNKPMTGPVAADYGYRWDNVTRPNDDTFVIVTMSGGGSRAAGFAYGVLQKLKATHVRTGRLVDSIDVVSSVSGGSFMSTYLALNGADKLDQFRKDFLEQNIQGDLVKAIFLPWNFFRLLLSPNFTRIDMAAHVYDNRLYHGATYANMPLRRPFVIANATEMDLGSQFQFTQEQFDPICSDLSKLPVAYGVASSSAFPGLLVPVAMGNFVEGCSYTPPPWYANGALNNMVNGRRYVFYQNLAALRDPKRPNLHLMDGGIADNIGLRGPYQSLMSLDTLQVPGGKGGLSVLRMINNRVVKRVAVIIVDAKTENPLILDKSAKTPNLINVLSTISTTPLANYSFETVELTIESIRQFMKDQRAAAPGAFDVEFYPIYVGFSADPKSDERRDLNKIGTNFSISKQDIDLLVDGAAHILDASPDFQRLVHDLQ